MTEYMRILLDELDEYLARGWRVVGLQGTPLVEGIQDGETLVCLVERDCEEKAW